MKSWNDGALVSSTLLSETRLHGEITAELKRLKGVMLAEALASMTQAMALLDLSRPLISGYAVPDSIWSWRKNDITHIVRQAECAKHLENRLLLDADKAKLEKSETCNSFQEAGILMSGGEGLWNRLAVLAKNQTRTCGDGNYNLRVPMSQLFDPVRFAPAHLLSLIHI